ncbi:MAG: lipid A deacylase LpxR family protein [Flavobacteriales bacterium]|nr:lipid A deacylase LpxR family protein [Flavobacteriales bacterium]
MQRILVGLLIMWPVITIGQKIDQHITLREMGHSSHFRFSYDNDYFASSDRSYTQGYSFEWSSPSLSRNPLSRILIKKRDSEIRHGLILEHIGFTPRDIVSEEIQFGDRPFASAIMLKSMNTSVDRDSKSRLTSTLSLGVIGPVAFGEWMQVTIHRALDNRIPGGWKNQIANDVIINYGLAHEKQLIRMKNRVAIHSDLAIQVGTLMSKAHAGAQIQVGLLPDVYNEGRSLGSWSLFAYGRPLLSAIEYDATLQGGKINRDSPYTIRSRDIERLVGSMEFGIIVQSPSMYLEFFRMMMSPEFNGGEAASYGGLKVGWKI